MAGNEIKDMTKGSPFTLILGFALPMLIGLLFQQFYSMVDTIIVGKYLGVKALAAVGSTGSLNFMIIGFCIGVCSGFAIPVAQRFGAGAGAEGRPRRPLPHPFYNLLRRHAGHGLVRHPVVRRH